MNRITQSKNDFDKGSGKLQTHKWTLDVLP